MQGAYLVTGASKGLGCSIAKLIASSGHPVIALARESVDLGVTGAALATLQPDSITVSCDLSDRADISGAATIIKSRFSHLAGIIHNAGTIHPIANMLDVERVDWARSIQVNLIGVQDLTNRLHSLLGGDIHTRITTISSGAANRSIHGWSAYCVAKAGLEMWTMCMAEEGADKNISAISIAPGIVNTDMQKDIRNAEETSFPSLSNFIEYYENGDLTNPDDVAKTLLPFCLSNAGETGQRLDVRNL
jgi:benzil reductase ((S)-benzoin forming)